MTGNGNISAIPMAKQSASETIENDLGRHLKSSPITSEIDFLKKMKLKTQLITSVSTSGLSEKEKDALTAIAKFQSNDDKRIQQTYSKLIKVYQDAEAEKNDKDSNKPGEVVRTKRNELSNLYSQFGYRDLYDIASTISEIQRTVVENRDIMGAVDGFYK
jgi:hypothetical protein